MPLPNLNSFRDDYLDRLPPWDGVPRIGTLLQTAFDLHLPTSQERLDSARASRMILMGAVARSYEPGSKADETVLLIGPPACGKSTFCRYLVPTQDGRQNEWFSDGLALGSTPSMRDTASSLMGRVVVECAEMTGTSQADIDCAKAFLSRTVDHVRKPFDRVAQDIPRQCIFIGTSNIEPALLGDPGGARRLLPIRIVGQGQRPVAELLDETRDLLWAEAVHRHKAGGR